MSDFYLTTEVDPEALARGIVFDNEYTDIIDLIINIDLTVGDAVFTEMLIDALQNYNTDDIENNKDDVW